MLKLELKTQKNPKSFKNLKPRAYAPGAAFFMSFTQVWENAGKVANY
jgi:hypothetical protein